MLKRIRKWLAVIMGIFMVMEIMPVRAQYDVVFAKSLGDGTKAVFYRDTELIVEGEPVLSSIYCEGYLKISGSGKLTVKCRSGDAITAESVECSADLLIEGNKKGTGIASSYGVKFETSIAAIENVGRGIAMDNGRFENIAGVLNVDSHGDGIITNRGDIMINGLTGIDCDGSCLTTMDGGIFVNNDLYAEAHGGDPALYSKDGDISFEGGSSHITADGICIKTGGNIFFEADVEAESAWHYAVYHCPSDTRPFVKLTAGKVRLTGDEIALRTLTDFYQEGGELTCVGGIAANADIILTGGTTRITSNGFNCIYCDTGAFQCLNKTTISNDSDNIAAVYTKSFITGTTADLIITSDETAVNTIKSGIKGKVFVSTKKGIAFQSNTFEMDGGNVTIIGDTYSIYAGSIDMKKGTLTTQNPMFAWNHDILLYGDVTAVSQDGNAITARENVIIDGRLNCVAGDDHAISADVVFFNTNANAELKANAEAVYARSFVGVHGNVIATSRDAEAIYAEGEIIAEHGSLRAIGKESALYAGTKVILTHSMHVMEPENGYANGHTVYAPHHQNAPDVLIDRSWCKVILWPNNGQDWIEYYVKADDYFMLPECPFVYPPGKKFARWEYGLPGEYIHIVDDLDVNVVWEDDLVSVRFDPDGGRGTMAPVSVLRYSIYELPECTFNPPAGKLFYAWRINDAGFGMPGSKFEIKFDLVLQPIWVDGLPEDCTVTFDAAGGSGSMPSVKVKRGGYYILPECDFAAPRNMKFSHWQPSTMNKGVHPGNSIQVNTDMTIKAVWEGIPVYTVSFSGSDSADPPAQFIREGGRVKQPLISRDGFVFGGWYTDPDCVHPYDFDTPVTKDFCLYAAWDRQVDEVVLTNLQLPRHAEQVWNHVETDGQPHYLVASCTWYEIDAGNRKPVEIPGMFEKEKRYQAEIILEPETDYAFSGGGTEQFARFGLNGSRDLVEDAHAVDRNTFLITTKVLDVLDACPVVLIFGEKGMDKEEMKAYEVPYGEPFTLPECMFTAPEGMMFSSWSEGHPGDVIYPVRNMLIEPLWIPATPETVTVTFVTGCDTVLPVQEVPFGSCATEPAPVYRNRYQFMGWYRDETFTKLFDFNAPVYTDLTLYAGWYHGSAGPDGWRSLSGREYWYENNGRQGTSDDPEGIMGDGSVRGRKSLIRKVMPGTGWMRNSTAPRQWTRKSGCLMSSREIMIPMASGSGMMNRAT